MRHSPQLQNIFQGFDLDPVRRRQGPREYFNLEVDIERFLRKAFLLCPMCEAELERVEHDYVRNGATFRRSSLRCALCGELPADVRAAISRTGKRLGAEPRRRRRS